MTTRLRLREGESNLLAGLLREDDQRKSSGFPGLMRLPVLKQLFVEQRQQITQTDIVMLLTPHIVRTHELTAEDLSPIYIGTQQNLGLGGPPPLIAPAAGRAGCRGGARADAGIPTTPGVPPGGVPRSPVASDPGAQPVESPGAARHVAGANADAASAGDAAARRAPPPAPAAPPAGRTTPPARRRAGRRNVRRTRRGDPAARCLKRRATAASRPLVPPATPAQIIVTPPGTEFRVAGGPYTVPVSINNASRVSVMTLTMTFNPRCCACATVQDGTFMRQGGVATRSRRRSMRRPAASTSRSPDGRSGRRLGRGPARGAAVRRGRPGQRDLIR